MRRNCKHKLLLWASTIAALMLLIMGLTLAMTDSDHANRGIVSRLYLQQRHPDCGDVAPLVLRICDLS